MNSTKLMRICDEMAFAAIGGTNTTDSKSTTTEALTLDRIADMLKLIPLCPFKEYMIKKGYNPDDGWSMILPESCRYTLCGSYTSFPTYVRFSSLHGNYICFVQDTFTMGKLKL